MTNLSSPSLIAETVHSPSHAPQLMQSELITYAMKKHPLFLNSGINIPKPREKGKFILPSNLETYSKIRDHAQAYTVLGKVDEDNVNNKAKLDYSHDSVEKEYDPNLHVQNRKHDIFPTLTLTPSPCVFLNNPLTSIVCSLCSRNKHKLGLYLLA